MAVTTDSPWFRLPVIGRYFQWLENNSPTGGVDRYPVVSATGQSEVPGVFIAGDLTGVPLLKLAADGGAQVVANLAGDSSFQREQANRAEEVYDLVVVGAGIAGVSAALAAEKRGLKYVVLEADRTFTTIRNFPAGKPISIYPLNTEQKSDLPLRGETKEALLENLEQHLAQCHCAIRLGESMVALEGEKGRFTVRTDQGAYLGLRVLLTVGKSGEAKRLEAIGSDLPKVLSRLIDPGEFAGKKILVVGGGDSALESALLLAEQEDTQVTLSYRGTSFTRPKPENIERLEEAVALGRLTVLLGSQVTEIDETRVFLKVNRTGDRFSGSGVPGPGGTLAIGNDAVFTMIGTRLPAELLGRAGIQLDSAWDRSKKILLATALFFSGMIYFGKSANAVVGLSQETPHSLLHSLLGAPKVFWGRNPEQAALGLLGWVSLLGFLGTGLLALGILGRRFKQVSASGWSAFKALYFFSLGLFVMFVYIAEDYLGAPLAGKGLGFWYGALYTVTMVVFGLRRMAVRQSSYIAAQTSILIGVQALFLFVLPEFILPWLGQDGLLSSWVMENIFPGGSYWRSYGFILAWPLFFSNLLYGQPTGFWLVVSLLQSFAIIPFFVWRFGKGAYCGWICSCGGLAETLGDEYRSLAPHSRRARSLEHVGQVILLVVLLLSLWNLLAPSWMGSGLSTSRKVYKVVVDVGLAGVVGVGFYFFLSGRVWCRFFCPLAALMHIYARLSVYRIFADKKKCISCGICTRVCHMGIDVMGYANKGRPLDDYECVRCSACVHFCPVSCLRFGRTSPTGPRMTDFGLKKGADIS